MPLRALLLLVLPLLAACEVRGPGTLAPGAPCDPDAPLRCEGPGASCLRLDADAGICTHACVSDAACPAGLTCQLEADGTTARCAPGFRCATDTECPGGHRCDAASGTCFIPVWRGLCSPCDADAQCRDEGGRCLEAQGTGERFCSRACDPAAAAPDRYVCRSIDASWLLVPESGTCEAGRALCAPCSGDAQCGDGADLCVENLLSGERSCGRACNPHCGGDPNCASECPPDRFRCADLGGDGSGPFQCVPRDGCDGWCEDDRACRIGESCNRNVCVPATDGRACAPCADDDDCSIGGSRCVVGVGGARFCAPDCGPGGTCSLGFVCADVANDRLCVPAAGDCTSGAGRLGESCGGAGAAGCLSGVCLQAGAIGLCSARCDHSADCGDASYACCAVTRAADGTKSWDCAAAPGPEGGVCAPRGGLFGDACDAGRPPCQDGHCLDLGASRLCTASCDSDGDCDIASGDPGGFVCRTARTVEQGDAPADAVRICFPAGGGAIGSDCTFGAAACADQLCLKKASGNVCTHACRGGADCPAGWSCGETTTVDGRRLSLCLPPSVAG